MTVNSQVDCSAAAQAFFDAYSAHDLEKMLALCAPEARLRYVPMGTFGEGPVRTLGRNIWNGLLVALPDLRVTVQSLVADTRTASAEVVIADDRRGYHLPHAFVLRFDGEGKITEVAAYWDNVNFAFQCAKALIASAMNIGAAIRRRPA